MSLEGRVLIQTAVATLNHKLRAPGGEPMEEGLSLKFPYFPKKPTASHLITIETKLKFLASSPVEPDPRLMSIYLPQKTPLTSLLKASMSPFHLPCEEGVEASTIWSGFDVWISSRLSL